ncbi:hypothetical protein R3P38DRAFT_562864 [Favolaschia claudopus]|uniref:JmjC domain-containing protein n=1 Tax=Favolaschia claudopus TaxID=2862362 RepID=A0AAV9ZA06_9AGAR
MQDQLPLPAKSNIQSTSVPDSSPAAPDVEQDIIPHTPPATLPESTGLNLTGSVSCRTRSQTGSLPLPKAQPKKPTESNNSNSGFSDSGSRSRRTGAKSRTTSHYVNLAEPAQQIPEQTRLREYPRLIKNVQRPTSPRSLPMTVYTPKPKIGEFRSQTFEYIMFSKFSSDCQMIENMLATQRANPRGIPQFLSADISRNPDPTIKPGFSQSFLYISTPMDLAKVTLRNQYLLHRHRCVMVLDIGADAPPAFDTKALWRVGDPDMLYLIQDIGLPDEFSQKRFADKLSNLLPHPGRPVLSTVYSLPHAMLPTPPSFVAFSSIQSALTVLEGHAHLPVVCPSRTEFTSSLVSTTMARTAIQRNLMATALQVVTGAIAIFVAAPSDSPSSDATRTADLSSRYALSSWQDLQKSGQKDLYRWQPLLLTPNTVLYIPSGAPYFMISIEDTIAVGFHTIHTTQVDRTVPLTLHHIVTEKATGNEQNSSVHWLLIRLFIFWVEMIIRSLFLFDLLLALLTSDALYRCPFGNQSLS